MDMLVQISSLNIEKCIVILCLAIQYFKARKYIKTKYYLGVSTAYIDTDVGITYP